MACDCRFTFKKRRDVRALRKDQQVLNWKRQTWWSTFRRKTALIPWERAVNWAQFGLWAASRSVFAVALRLNVSRMCRMKSSCTIMQHLCVENWFLHLQSVSGLFSLHCKKKTCWCSSSLLIVTGIVDDRWDMATSSKTPDMSSSGQAASVA